MLLAILYACDRSEEKPPEPSEPTSQDELVDGCDPVVRVPGPLGTIDPTPADPHSDTFGAMPEPQQLRLGTPSSDPSRSISFLWRTDVDTLATVLEYGTGGALTERVEGASFRYGGTSTTIGNQRIHEVKLCGQLEPGTTYSYRVGGEGHWSEIATFTTPGEPGSFDTFRLAIAGDSRGAYETWGALLESMASHEPDLLLFSGDMVELGPNQAEWDAWFRAAGDVLQRIPMLPAHGNHEFMAPHYFAQWSLPGNEQWYTVRYGDLQLVSLNDTVPGEAELQQQASFLDEVFGASDATWKLSMHHQSLYATCARHGSNETLRTLWGPKYDAHGVQVVLAGHNHIYERSIPIYGEAPAAEGQGTVYLVSGGAGAPLYTSTTEEWFGLVANPIEHYIIADFGPEQATFVVRDLAGNVIDEFTVTP